MRIDDKLKMLPLSEEQYLFASCWYNMVHAYSLDSYRVRAMNPANCLRELHRMMAPHANPADCARVADELHAILISDPILENLPFRLACEELVEFLASADFKDQKKFQRAKPLVYAYSRELLAIIEEQYIPAILAALDRCLITDIDAVPEGGRDGYIQTLTGNLLSTLLDRGGSIESLFQLYRQVICKSGAGDEYDFGNNFGILGRLITKEPRQFVVVFAVDNISNPQSFPNGIGAVSFSPEPPVENAHDRRVTKYLAPRPKRLFATVSVQTVDYRDAGKDAYEKINDILDLVRFEYERSCLQIPDEFAITDAHQKRYRIYPIPKVVPNPDTSIDNEGLQGFVKSVNELVGNPDLQEDERKRVQSAFRLYRAGADTNIFENKLLSWWTAIEYLVRGSALSGGIGDAVEQTLTPVLCLRYIDKLIISFRNALVDQKASIKNPQTAQPIQLRELGSGGLYKLFKDSAYHDQLLDASTDPFMKKKFEDFLQSLSEPNDTAQMLKAHERRLRWHIQRIYRARCDIIHSAERIVSASLLCANLEFYLKTTLTVLLRALRATPYITGPREFFDRQAHEYGKLLHSLSQGQEHRLLLLLDN